MQMVLLLITGYGLAAAPAVHKGLIKLANWGNSPRQVILIVGATSIVMGYFNWALAIIGGAFLAREVARARPDVDIRVLGAAAFSGNLVVHGGLSASVPLLINTPGHFLESQIGLIPLDQTIFQIQNLFITFTLAILTPLICVYLIPKKEHTVSIDPSLIETESDEIAKPPAVMSLGDRLDYSRILNGTLVLMGASYLAYLFYRKGFSLNLNLLIFIFLVLGIALHGNLVSYTKVLVKGASSCAGIILQYPFYAGIMGIMKGSGLVALISEGLLSFATPGNYELICYFSSLIISIFLPSAGGHWVVQAPFMLPPAFELGVPVWKVAMGVAWGESVWNVVCPFWMLPLMAIAKISLRQIMGFTLPLFLVGNVVAIFGILFFQ